MNKPIAGLREGEDWEWTGTDGSKMVYLSENRAKAQMARYGGTAKKVEKKD